MTNSKFDLCLTMDKTYVLGAIDMIGGTYTTAEDVAAFETALAKFTKEVAKTGNVEILSFNGVTAVILPHYGIADALEVDIDMEEFVRSTKGFISEKVKEAFAKVNSPIESKTFLSALEAFDAEIYRKSAYWAENREPEYPLQATKDRNVSVDDGFELKQDYTISITPTLRVITKPEMPIMVSVPSTSDLVRAFKDTLAEDDYIYQEDAGYTTAEFTTNEEREDMYRIPSYQLYTGIGEIVKFNYFAEILAPSKDAIQLTELAMQSVYYKQNLRTIKANLGIDNENLEYLVGHSDISSKINANEVNMYKVFQNLLISSLMYEYNFYSSGELSKQGEIRSNLFDTFMIGYIRRLIKENYSYTGKAYLSHEEMDEEDEGVPTLDLYGYDRIQMINGAYTLIKLTQEDLIKRSESFLLDGDQKVMQYLNDIVSSAAYIDMFVLLMRFGATKNRYVKVDSKKEPKYPYFDTLLFKSIAAPTIDAYFEVQKTASGKTYTLTGDVRLDKVFEEYGSCLSLPVGVVLTQLSSNGSATREKNIVLDITSFCSTVTRLREDKVPYYEVEGINFDKDGKVTVDKEVINRTLTNHYNAMQVVHLLQSESETKTFTVEVIPAFRKQINGICNDAGMPSTSYTFFDAYKSLEEGEFGYKETLTKPTLANFSSPAVYVAVRVASAQLQSEITRSISCSFAQLTVIDAIESAILLTANRVTDTSNKFNEFLQGEISKYCKIVNASNEEVGYAFVASKNGKEYMLVTSRKEIGLRMPTVRSWRILPFSPKFEAICKQFNTATDKDAFRDALMEKRYIFDTIDTFRILQEGSV